MSLAPLRILVTGAASGIGAALCQRIAAPGVKLLIHTRAREADAVAEAVELLLISSEQCVLPSSFDPTVNRDHSIDAVRARDTERFTAQGGLSPAEPELVTGKFQVVLHHAAALRSNPVDEQVGVRKDVVVPLLFF